MTLQQFLQQYDLQEGDIVEMEDGEKYLYNDKNDTHVFLLGPLPSVIEQFFPMEHELKPLRVLRPDRMGPMPQWKRSGRNGLASLVTPSKCFVAAILRRAAGNENLTPGD